MNIKFKLVPKQTPAVLPEIQAIRKLAEAELKIAKDISKEPSTLDELLYGKEIGLDELISSD